jgi:K+-sensing histidine kinase KdpD
MLERLFSVVAHDLRSPVSTLSNLSDLLNQPIADLTENERQTIIKHMDGITKSTVSLLDNLLDWSRKQQGLIGYDPEIVNVNEVLNESLMWMDMIAKNKDIQIHNEITDGVKVFVDRSALSLLFRNLIINAIKFSHSKGQIRVFFKDDNQQVIIGVEDKGVGMPSEKLNEVISGKNNKSDSGTNNEMGTGFGIRLCKEFIAINKGKLWAESIENTQTIFYFSVPKVD